MNLRIVAIVCAAPLAIAAALAVGSAGLSLNEVISAIGGSGDEISRRIVWDLRLPRALAAFACGALLALAGALLQVLLRNPLADPFLLGISGGAASGALAALLLGASLATQHLLGLAGALGAALVVFAFSIGPAGWNPYRVLLTGVALSSAFGAFVSLMLTLAPAAQVPGLLFWLLGDLSSAGDPRLAGLALAAAAILAQSQAASLNLLVLGEDPARALGVAVSRVQWIAFACAAAATVAAVLLGGSIGFVGLVIPHVVRLLGLHDHRVLLPMSACLGGAFLTFADAAARSIAAPVELPVGALTALIGVPVLLLLLARTR